MRPNSRVSRVVQRFGDKDLERMYWPLGPGWPHSYAMLLISNDFGAAPNADLPENRDAHVSSMTFVDEHWLVIS